MKTDNELIAEFMGMVKNKGNQWAYENEIEIIDNESYVPIWWHTADLAYDTSWDWLMSVVDKIEALNFTVQIINYYCKIQHPKYPHFNSDSELCLSKIEAVYKVVVEFIKWYNTTRHSFSAF